MMDKVILGVDGGGTACRVALALLDGTRLADVEGGPANVTSDPDGAVGAIMDAVARALRDASVRIEDVAAAHLGLAGVLADTDTDALAERFGLPQVTVSDDRMTTLIGTLGDRDGSVASVGTGSFVGHCAGDAIRFLGGWGLQVGDQASGAWLGRRLLEQCLRAHDGLDTHTDLTQQTLAHFGDEAVRITRFARTATPRDYAEFAKDAVVAAMAGDALGRALMEEGAAYLNACLAQGPDGDAISLTGSLGPSYAPYLAECYQSRLSEPDGTALDGALSLARQVAFDLATDR